ncbi:MAG: DUF5689 domain-containing protein [Prevotellaceae bacterium]|jgi:hypothetical protein|nr:DUF5689 domain-containing protein [Prevotellaceae bacterium]
MKNTIKISVLIFAVVFSSCKKYAPVAPDDSTPRTATHSIQKLIEEFGSQFGDMFPVRSNSYQFGDPNNANLGLFSVDTIPSVETYGSEIIIAGRVTSDDLNGNMYKYIVIQDVGNSDYSLKISVDASGISSYYPLGSIVTIKCNGLAIGKYADMFQLGVVYYNIPNAEDEKKGLKKGYEPGRMPFPLFDVRAKVHGMPELDKIKVDTLTVAQIKAKLNDRAYHARLVCIKNAYFTQTGDAVADIDQPEGRIIFAPSTNGFGFPQAVDISDGTGIISVCTSEYARFATATIPAADYKGNITALLMWYRDSSYEGKTQLTLRSLDDLNLKNAAGDKWLPVLPY